jgi:glycosyltransferase involved in cell wall biosynthesis
VLLGLICRVPSVVSLHGEDDEVIKARGFSKPIRFVAWIIITLVISLASGIWCVSEGVADYARRRGARKGRVRTIFNKVRVDRFLDCGKYRKEARKELGYSEEDFVIIHVGRFSPDKRIHVIIEALALIKSQGIENVKLLLVGGPPIEASKGMLSGTSKKRDYVRDESTFDEIIKEVNELDLRNNVQFTGFQHHDKVPYYMSAAEAYVIAMKLIGFGIAVAEASAAGLALIGSQNFLKQDYGILVNPKTGVTFNPDNPESLAERILFLRNNPDIRLRMAEESRKNSLRFRWDRIAAREARYYQEVIGLCHNIG